jgi:oxaloacetate decarboxylase alpha subunit
MLEPALDRLRRERGVFDSDDDLLLAAFYNRTEYDALKLAGPISTEYPLSSTPLVTLVKELVQRKDIRSFNLVRHQKTTSTGVKNNV